MKTEKRRAIFLDRDGTVSEEVGYVNHLSRFRLLPHSLQAIRRINRSGFLAVLVTNQAGVARAYFKEPLVQQVHRKLAEMLAAGGAYLDAVYYCPHHPSVGEPPYRRDCDCRKPRPGMVRAAERDLGVEVSRSYMIGDKHSDITFAHSLGMRGVLVKTGYGLGELEQWGESWDDRPDAVAEDLLGAVEWILSQGDGS